MSSPTPFVFPSRSLCYLEERCRTTFSSSNIPRHVDLLESLVLFTIYSFSALNTCTPLSDAYLCLEGYFSLCLIYSYLSLNGCKWIYVIKHTLLLLFSFIMWAIDGHNFLWISIQVVLLKIFWTLILKIFWWWKLEFAMFADEG